MKKRTINRHGISYLSPYFIVDIPHPAEELKLRTISKLGLSYFIALIGFSAVGTIWAIFLESLLHNPSHVGFLSTFFTLAGFIAFLFITPLIQRTSKTKLLFISLVLFSISYLLFSRYSNLFLVVLLGTLLAIFASLRVTAFGLIVRDKTKGHSIAKNEGLVYSFFNLAWLIGPILAGFIAQEYGFGKVFFLASILCLISLISFLSFSIKDNRISKKVSHNVLKVFL